ncbi:MAG TPA: 3-deoxy-D-manno-octulosonic acid kinase [Povalibacter sp.]|nr:3-deoxy-D-manno-octulosonic acid kinase [Povalibacter sp.]
MSVVHERLEVTDRGGILYDASLLRKPQDAWFAREYWAESNAVREVVGGRGSVCFLQTEAGGWVLRHYLRGGLIARIASDSYFWWGAARTRSFAEWRLLAELRRRELPVPAPVAARYVRSGLTYRADLITVELPTSLTLASAMTQALPAAGWRAVGHTIARFHAQGVQHADLNAHNILLGADDTVYVLDFDRGRIRTRGSWEQTVLARLKRSLEKISSQRGVNFDAARWGELMSGYEKRLAVGG